MEITDVPYAVLRFQYQLARFPLQLIGEQVVAGMGSEAPTRLFYERWLGGLDASVGKMLVDPDLEQRGAALLERSDALRRAAQLDATATQNQERADDELKAKRDKAIEDQNDARAVKEREVEERKGAAAEAAQQRTAAAKQQADDVAAQLKRSAEAAKREEQATITAAEQKATAAAESKLDDAQAKRSDAASKRAQADQVEELASLEKEKRQSERASDA
jgi:hypothetical protein